MMIGRLQAEARATEFQNLSEEARQKLEELRQEIESAYGKVPSVTAVKAREEGPRVSVSVQSLKDISSLLQYVAVLSGLVARSASQAITLAKVPY
jgi:hypothetical protein